MQAEYGSPQHYFTEQETRKRRILMKRRLTALALSAAMALSLAACGSSGNSTSAGAPAQETAVQEAPAEESAGAQESEDADPAAREDEKWTGEISHISMTYLTFGQTPADMDKVVAKINELTIPKIGVEIEFVPLGIYDSLAQYPLWISSGENVDLINIAFQDISTYINQGLIIPLNDIVASSAPNISKMMQEYPLVDGSYKDGEFYGISPRAQTYGSGNSIMIPRRVLDSVGVVPEEDHIYSMEELGEIFAKEKEAFPDQYMMDLVTSSITGSRYGFYNSGLDALGATNSSGLLMGKNSTEVKNLYATEEYAAYLNTIRDWYQKGYIHPDAATTSQTGTEWVTGGVALGNFVGGEPNQLYGAENLFGEPCYQLQTVEPFMPAKASSGAFWSIPITSKDPEGAMRFLDLMYDDTGELLNLILWGIEGEHYVMVDPAEDLIGFPEGIDSTTSGYYVSFGFYGNRAKEYIWDMSSSHARCQAYTDWAMQNKTKGYGFCYDPSNYADQIAAINAVEAQYLPVLESGSADPAKILPEFLQKLDAAGINEVIADKQAQFDEWLAQQ